VDRLFVYGTLRRGEAAAHLMSEASFAGDASIRASVLLQNGYRGLVPGDELIPGEVFDVPDELFARLDQYEGPGYVRRLTEVDCGGERMNAWVYWLV
jgi:gamma-glutamylcyclotransferase (GGCT)/AIG2-like uncharacterized protein YtfP